jgi:uncharacterized protein YgbK (DUF1537 family)
VTPGRPLAVLDDDPTGTQSVSGVRILFEWEAPSLVAAALDGRPAVHLLTNSRAYPPERAYAIVAAAARAAVAALARPRLVLRGDSTLRAHVLEEYLAVRDVVSPGTAPPLLLVPALPAAGRITVGGVHLMERDGVRTPLHETEYARDPAFAYSDARLLAWAEERSGGFFARGAGREVRLEELRERGPGAVADALAGLAEQGAPAVCAPDAETVADLELVAEGLRLAERAGVEPVIRSAPAFVGVLGGCLAAGPAPPPRSAHGVLVVCGSYVPQTTRQLDRLLRSRPGTLVEVDVRALASEEPDAEVARAAAVVRTLLDAGKLAVVATPRERPPGTTELAAGERIAGNLARILRRLDPLPGIVLAKGGITSAVTAHVGLEATGADVLGPLVPGVALWRVEGRRGAVDYVVFPGNVGDDGTLAEVVDLLAPR